MFRGRHALVGPLLLGSLVVLALVAVVVVIVVVVVVVDFVLLLLIIIRLVLVRFAAGCFECVGLDLPHHRPVDARHCPGLRQNVREARGLVKSCPHEPADGPQAGNSCDYTPGS